MYPPDNGISSPQAARNDSIVNGHTEGASPSVSPNKHGVIPRAQARAYPPDNGISSPQAARNDSIVNGHTERSECIPPTMGFPRRKRLEMTA